MFVRLYPVFFFVVLSLVGCGSDPTLPGPVPDAGLPVATCDASVELETGDLTGHAMPLGAGPGEARAGRITDAQLPADPDGLSTAHGGDFVLANNRIAMIIEDVGDSDLFDPWGGRPVGLAQVRDGALVEPADFNELIFGIGRFAIETESVSVISDGSSGGPAIVRAVGNFSALEFVDEIARLIAPEDYGSIRGAIDYELAPDKDYVDVKMTFASPATRPYTVNQVLHAAVQTWRMPAFVPERGFERIDMGSGLEIPWMGFIEDGATSYALITPHGNLKSVLDLSGVFILTAPPLTIPACSTTSYHHARIVTASPGLDALVQAVASVSGTALREVTGRVVDAGGNPVSGARVHAESETSGYLTRSARTDATGAYAVHVPASETVTLQAWRRGDVAEAPVVASPGAATPDLRFVPAGAIHVVARDAASHAPLPVRVQILPSTDEPVPPLAWGEQRVEGGRVQVAFPVSGDVTLGVPAGHHRVIVSRGYEYELATEDVDVAAGATVDVAADLARVVDTTGMLCADYHIHTFRSPDSEDAARDKVACAVADGLEILVRSDHEWVNDFEPAIAELGVGAFAFGVTSLELTTFAWGHFGVFPLVADSTKPNAGAVRWVGRLPPDVFAEIRARPEQPVFIINHPRNFGGLSVAGSSFARLGSYFDAAGYDPTTGLVENMPMWDESFELVEVFNDRNWDQAVENGVVGDWLSFLSQGKRVFTVGSSDSHHIMAGPTGYPRTCLYVGTDDPRALTPNMVRDVTRRGASTIAGGIYVSATGPSGVGPGGEATGVGERTTVHVTVQAASWVDVRQLRVFVDGAMTETIPLDPSALPDPSRPALRFEGDVSVDVSSTGSYVILVASGDMTLEPVHPRKMPFGVTNPIFLRR